MGSATSGQESLGHMRKQADHPNEQCSLMACFSSRLRVLLSVSALGSRGDGL